MTACTDTTCPSREICQRAKANGYAVQNLAWLRDGKDACDAFVLEEVE